MRVALVATDAYGGHGGIALYNRDLAEALAARHDVFVLPRVAPRAIVGVPPGVTFYGSATTNAVAYLHALAAVAWRRPDLVICGHVNLVPVACALARDPVLTIFGMEAWTPPPRRLSRLLLSRCRAVVSISEVTLERFRSWSDYRGPAHVLPNAIRLEEFGIRPRRADLVERYGLGGRRVLLTVGRLAGRRREKGFDEVLEILPSLPNDIAYVIAGDGEDRDRLERRAMELGISSRVTFTGPFEDGEKADLFNLADVYVMPSRGEGFGFVFLEALASGVPVIGSSVDGGREALLGGRLGALVDPSDQGELRSAILTALERGPRHVPEELQHFSYANFVARLMEILERLR